MAKPSPTVAAASGKRRRAHAELRGVTSVREPSGCKARAKSAAEANRSAGTLASALVTACSTPSGIPSRTVRRGGMGWVSRFAMIAWKLGPVYGGSPASISYTTQASE